MAPAKKAVNGANFTQTIHSDTYLAIEPTTQSDHTGHHIFISGASKGIGRATVLALTKAGAAGLVLGARSSLNSLEKEIQETAKAAGKPPPKVLSLQLDVTDQKSVEAAAKAVEDEFGYLDILINNAGSMDKAKPLVDSDPDEWWKTWTVNMLGPYLLTRALLPLLLQSDHPTKSKSPQIINLSSIGAHLVAPGMSAYQCSKLAILRFSDFINAEYSSQGLVAYSFHPGAIMTELASNMPPEKLGAFTDTLELGGDSIAWWSARQRENERKWLAGRYVSCTWDVEELVGMRDEIVGKDLLKTRMAV